MKKPQWFLIGITGVFLCIMLGIFIGRKTDRVYVPMDAFSAAPMESSPEINNTGKIDLNTATLQQLQLLPGIGPTIAQRILDYRETAGRFETIQQITNVSGIGEKTFDKLKDYITVEVDHENSGS